MKYTPVKLFALWILRVGSSWAICYVSAVGAAPNRSAASQDLQRLGE